MWGRLLTDTYNKVRTKADEVRQQVSSTVQAQQATISKARDVLFSLGTAAGGGGGVPRGVEAFATAAANGMTAEELQVHLQREASTGVKTVQDVEELLLIWRQMILQSPLHGSPQFPSAEYASYLAEKSSHHDASSSSSAPPPPPPPPPLLQSADPSCTPVSSGQGGAAAKVAHSIPGKEEPQEDREHHGPSTLTTSSTAASPTASTGDSGGGPLEAPHEERGKSSSVLSAGRHASPGSAHSGVSLSPPVPPTFGEQLRQESEKGESMLYGEAFSFKEVLLRSNALERCLLTIARRSSLRNYFATHTHEVLLCIQHKKHRRYSQAQQHAEGHGPHEHDNERRHSDLSSSPSSSSSSSSLHSSTLPQSPASSGVSQASTAAVSDSQIGSSSQGDSFSVDSLKKSSGALTEENEGENSTGKEGEKTKEEIPSQKDDGHSSHSSRRESEGIAGGPPTLVEATVSTHHQTIHPPPPPLAALLAVMSICLPGPQESHLELLHALFTAAAAAAAAAAASAAVAGGAMAHHTRGRPMTTETSKSHMMGVGGGWSDAGDATKEQREGDKEHSHREKTMKSVEEQPITPSTGKREEEGTAEVHEKERTTPPGDDETAGMSTKQEEKIAAKGGEKEETSSRPFCSAVVVDEGLEVLETVLQVVSVWKKTWYLERKEDARRRLEEEARHLAAKIEDCDLAVNDDEEEDPLLTHHIRLLASSQLLELQQKIIFLKKSLMAEQTAACMPKLELLEKLKQGRARLAANFRGGRSAVEAQRKQVQVKMAEESELLMKEASEIEERRVALHAKLKAARDQRRELEEKLEECIKIISQLEVEQHTLQGQEESIHWELRDVQQRYKHQVYQKNEQERQQELLEEALEELNRTGDEVVQFFHVDQVRRKEMTANEVQKLREALQIQVCRHFAFEKTRLQQQVQFLYQCMASLTSFQQKEKGALHPNRDEDPTLSTHSIERDEGANSRVFLSHEDKVVYLRMRKRFLRGVQQLDVMLAELQTFARRHRKTLFGAIRQQHDHLKHRMQKETKEKDSEERKDKEEEEEDDIGEQEEDLDPMKDILSLYTQTKKQIAPFLANLYTPHSEFIVYSQTFVEDPPSIGVGLHVLEYMRAYMADDVRIASGSHHRSSYPSHPDREEGKKYEGTTSSFASQKREVPATSSSLVEGEEDKQKPMSRLPKREKEEDERTSFSQGDMSVKKGQQQQRLRDGDDVVIHDTKQRMSPVVFVSSSLDGTDEGGKKILRSIGIRTGSGDDQMQTFNQEKQHEETKKEEAPVVPGKGDTMNVPAQVFDLMTPPHSPRGERVGMIGEEGNERGTREETHQEKTGEKDDSLLDDDIDGWLRG
ncbi:hypothetical protein CSUI_001674 [Cystoisospora suis]|uniref:Uncharacterized protein n=1 Tax=Cystoisospora suis TaxID=483139 RepID=A0A2C6LBP1_9APIC|nr:hypothetical protein CSUI_001674 [Cystoisospora suis]